MVAIQHYGSAKACIGDKTVVDEVDDIRRRRRRTMGGSRDTYTTSIPQGEGARSALNARVEEMAASPPSSSPLSENDRDEQPDFTPQNRMDEVRRRASSYEREYRLKLVHRMLMRNVPLDQIAQELDISVNTVMRDRKILFQRLKEEAKKLDIHKLIGDTMGFYQEVQGMSLRAASITKLPMNMRIASMRTALSSKDSLHRFLNTVGVFDVLKFRVEDEGSGSDIQKLMAATESLLASEDNDPLQSIAKLPEDLTIDEDEEIHLVG